MEKYVKDILSARVYDVAVETPVHRATGLSQRLGNAVFLKREDMQPVYSFKVRGAYNKMLQLTPEAARRGVIAASAGNHAQGVALAGSTLGTVVRWDDERHIGFIEAPDLPGQCWVDASVGHVHDTEGNLIGLWQNA